MAGEAAEFYLTGSTNFEMGTDIIKGSGSLRYMADPTLDGLSIDHASDYYSGLNVHYSSGVYNKAFYILANTPGWDVKMAFMLFAEANRIWTPSESFDSAYGGVLLAADSLGYDKSNIADAFGQVGIPAPPVCNDIEPADLMNGVSTKNFGAAAGEWNCWRLNVAADNATSLDVDLRNTAKGRFKSGGDADLYVKYGSRPLVDPLVFPPDGDFDCGSYSSNSDESCSIPNATTPTVSQGYWYIAVYAWADFSSISLTSTYTVPGSEPLPDTITLTATEKGGRNKKFVNLTWTGATTTEVEIYRNSELIVTTTNDGSYKDNGGISGSEYRLCETNAGNCSGTVTAN
jgi:vibriolysin